MSKKSNYLLSIILFELSILINEITSTNSKSSLGEQTSRCPKSAKKPGIYLHSDKKLCNVYHECNCSLDNNSLCAFVKTNVCPIGKIFLNLTNKCEPIELFGCETSYLQTINLQSKNRTLEKDLNTLRSQKSSNLLNRNILPELVNITGTSEFSCPPGVNERFADPNICNIFHVCVSRGEQTYDQPFLCPFSSVFRVIDSRTMYCDKRHKNDCNSKAFYRSAEEDDYELFEESEDNLVETNITSSIYPCSYSGKIEDKSFCNLYHSCLNGKDLTYICESQLLFNPISNICDYPINVPCFEKKIYKKSSESNLQQSIKLNFNSLENVTLETVMPETVTATDQNMALQNGSKVTIYGTPIELNCLMGSRNYLIPDKTYCNVFHHCHGNSGNVFVCEKGQAFDVNANGPNNSGVCNFEDLVNCAGKYILTETGQRNPKLVSKPTNSRLTYNNNGNNKNTEKTKQGSYLKSFTYPNVGSTNEELITGIPFDCRRKSNGHWKDTRYCDVYHACIGGEQKKTYSCAQLGERIYFDETTKRCEFLKNNPSGCLSNTYYQTLTKTLPAANALVSDEPNEAWKNFIRSREQFSCIGRLDGFYASRWCNVFYRCFIGVKTEFLCPKMLNSDRLWWVQHGSSQETPQNSAACVWPCETKKQCVGPGGAIIESGDGNYVESPLEADRVWRRSNCAENTGIISDIFKIPDQDFSCIGLPEGNFFPSKYCNIFHRCTSGKRKDFQCAKATNSPYDLWWNEATNQCDWPCKVSCNKPVYASSKPAAQIQMEDRSLNEEECRRAVVKNMPLITTEQFTQAPTTTQTLIASISIMGTFPDENLNLLCINVGLVASLKYCNVYYDCKNYGQSTPNAAFYCVDGYFDNLSKGCRPSNMVQCPFNPQLVFPFISIGETNTPEDVMCSQTIGAYVIHSNRYCNIYYSCDGRSSKPSAFRCYDRDRLEDGIFNRDTRKCVSKQTSNCLGEFLSVKLRYQSSPVDHLRLPDLAPLSCRGDQQYLAEHDKYCNLYHSCILGKYQMYSCLTVGSYDKTSYFYYTNGDCAAPNSAQCGPNKAIYPYEKLFPNEIENGFISELNPPNNRFLPIISPSLSFKGQSIFGSVSLKYNLPYSITCNPQINSYLMPHSKFCNLFYECVKGKLTTFACVDSSTGQFSGIYDEKINGCKPYSPNECLSNSLYNPEDNNISETPQQEPYENPLELKQLNENGGSFKTESNFSCINKPSGYYESEWCNIFYRCLNGKRIDTKCSSGLRNGEFSQYDLWWEYQNSTYDPYNPIVFIGPDEDAKCEWPCKVKCTKPIWVEHGKYQSSKMIFDTDIEMHPGCGRNGENLNKKIEVESSSSQQSQIHQIPQFQAFETENLNPSGFFCENDGTFKDPLFCNIFHVCANNQKKTYQCKSFLNSENDQESLFDPDQKICTSKKEGFPKCNGVIYDANFMNLPAYRDVPYSNSCMKSGIARAYGKDAEYCDLYYWCEKPFAEPMYFYCEVSIYGKELAFFNLETKKCDYSYNVKCDFPRKIYANSMQTRENKDTYFEKHNNDIQQDMSINVKNGPQQSPYMKQIVSGLLDPAPGFLSLTAAQFQTNFVCPFNAAGYYPNNEYCDIFHYCYNNGQFKTYVCASMQNEYQLWWSHQTEPGRRDNIFCDWPCNLVGPNTVCPAEKRVLMRDRKQVPGGIHQQEVLKSTCPNTNSVPPFFKPPRTEEPVTVRSRVFTEPQEPLNVHNTNRATVTWYSPCTNSNEWYMSLPTIKCNPEYKFDGFAPDPKDCSKFYRCEQNNEYEETSTGYLMACVAGLWWDQARRMCASPSEVKCNPYEIINSQGNDYGSKSNSCAGLTCAQVGLAMKNHMKNIPGRPNSFYKCDGQCAVEMACPLDLIFENQSQRCEWTKTRMSSLKALDLFSKNLTESKSSNRTSMHL